MSKKMKIAVFETTAQAKAYDALYEAMSQIHKAFNLSYEQNQDMAFSVLLEVKRAIDEANDETN